MYSDVKNYKMVVYEFELFVLQCAPHLVAPCLQIIDSILWRERRSLINARFMNRFGQRLDRFMKAIVAKHDMIALVYISCDLFLTFRMQLVVLLKVGIVHDFLIQLL